MPSANPRGHWHRWAVLIGIAGVCFGTEPPTPSATQENLCTDDTTAKVVIKPGLDCEFFKTSKFAYPWWILADADGNIQTTLGDQITADDLVQLELTAQCLSTHQGEHDMNFCSAVATTDGVVLHVKGGMPAYASSLTIRIDGRLQFTCAFDATYPSPTHPLRWRITSKRLELKSNQFKPGTRLRGYLSVEFEEIDSVTKKTRPYKIQGYIKPIVQSRPDNG